MTHGRKLETNQTFIIYVGWLNEITARQSFYITGKRAWRLNIRYPSTNRMTATPSLGHARDDFSKPPQADIINETQGSGKCKHFNDWSP